MGFCNCCTILYVPFSFAIILMGKRELVSLLSLSSWCLVIWVYLQLVIVVFPEHTHLLILIHVLHLLSDVINGQANCLYVRYA